MLHGYAQDGNTFRQKTSRIREGICQLYPDARFYWLDGPIRLQISGIPGLDNRAHDGQEHDGQEHDGPELRAWYDFHSVAGSPPGLFDSLSKIADMLKREGPFDGIIAFSQGALLAAKVASLLDGEACNVAHSKEPNLSTTRFQQLQAFRELTHPPLKFGIFFASSVEGGKHYSWLHGDRGDHGYHKTSTPFCLVNGRWDPTTKIDDQYAVFSKLSKATICSIVEHGGGNCVPTDPSSIRRVVAFILGATCLRSRGGNMKAATASRCSEGVDPLALQQKLQKLQDIRQNVLR